ncbi:DUF192 domain-containing protein [Desertibaculum subflavum]|uniref:DUF192 domain-containing protein n=1 Tax=Desertibaculum subflavum TaxID=2268458 RepID=UPI000E66DD52
MSLTRRLLLLAALLLAAVPALAQPQTGLPVTEIVIQTATGKHKFQVELATTPDQMQRGLMYRREMAADHGMLFDYGSDQAGIAMWMKNTFIPLDMLFVKADGAVLNIAERTVPGSLVSVPAAGPVRAVIELNGGTASRLKIKPGDKVLHPIFGSKP